MTNLLPCPFCGGSDLRENKKCVGCACGAQGPYDTDDNIAAWNDRASRSSPEWRTDMKAAPRDRPFLVEENDGDRIQYHVARYTGADKTILFAGGYFAFDMGKLTRWREFDLPAPEQGEPT